MSEPRFVDRVEEIEALQKLARSGIALPIYLYGPEGCGKTRLLREFVEKFDGVAVYIDALEHEKVENALITNPVLKELERLVEGILTGVSGAIGAYLASRVASILERIAIEIGVKGKELLIVVDDVSRAIGLDKVEWYVKWLYELIKKLWEKYEPRSVLVIATTSEGQSLDLVLRHTYASARLIWNLGREAFNELVRELSPPKELDMESLWRATGGNPRALIDIARSYGWNVDAWLDALKRKLARVLATIRSRNLVKELKRIIENPDAVYDEPSPEMEELYRVLVEENLFVYKYIATLSGKEIPEDPDLGIGKYYAWQIPAYKHVLWELL